MTVTAFSNCDEVELQLNGRVVGRKVLSERAAAAWEVPYETGQLAAIGYVGGRECAREVLRTAGAPARLEATFDRQEIQTAEVVHVVLKTVDTNGVAFPHFETAVTVTVAGAGTLLGLDNGIQTDPTPLRSSIRVPEQGRLLALIQAGKAAGPLTFMATADGLEPLEVTIQVR